MNDYPQNPDPPRKRKMHPALIILLVVVAALALPLIIYAGFLAAALLTPGRVRWN
jgi:hypothetical protein